MFDIYACDYVFFFGAIFWINFFGALVVVLVVEIIGVVRALTLQRSRDSSDPSVQSTYESHKNRTGTHSPDLHSNSSFEQAFPPATLHMTPADWNTINFILLINIIQTKYLML